MKINSLIASAAAALLGSVGVAQAATTVTIGTVNNSDMIVMQKLSSRFEAENPDIKLDWVVLEENVLRQRLTTDIATRSGQFDVVTIGTYEVPIWGGKDWLVPLKGLPSDYDLDDVLQSIRDGLSHKGELYALPFYAESSMTFYNSALLGKAGLTMPDQPSWDQVKGMAAKVHDPANGVYGICLRGKPGWGENMALVSTMVNTHGGRWFDEKWKPELDSAEWQQAVSLYIELQQKYGPPGASSNGFNENQALFSSGKCGMWIDATSAAGGLYNRSESQVADSVGFAQAPMAVTPRGNHWLWSWALAIPKTSDAKAAAQKFMTWATSKSYIEMVGESEGWARVPPGTRKSTYDNPKYQSAAPFAPAVLEAIKTADPTRPSAKPVPYTGVQYVGIPEFQSIGTQVGQTIAGALAGQMTVKQALKSVQSSVSRTMRRAGYPK